MENDSATAPLGRPVKDTSGEVLYKFSNFSGFAKFDKAGAWR